MGNAKDEHDALFKAALEADAVNRCVEDYKYGR
jgi:hypothetical protein